MHHKFAMTSLIASILIWITTFGFVNVSTANASPSAVFGIPSMYLAETSAQPTKDWMTQLETEILPQIETILNPDQQEQFQASIAEGMSFRKAFKALVLTPEQKTQFKAVLNSTKTKDVLASLTPDQKKQLFLKKKDLFKPTAQDIEDKIEASLNDKGLELPAGVKEKIDAGLKQKDSFVPSVEAITEKIETGMSTIKDKLAD